MVAAAAESALAQTAGSAADHRRILVLPSRTGAGFLLLLSLMLVAAINFQNNLALALVLWLLALMMVSMLHAYMNLSGLRVIALRAHPAFAGQPVRFELELRRSEEHTSE